MKALIVLSIVIMASCSAPRTLYISNRTGQTVILLVELGNSERSGTQKVFEDSIHGRSVPKGHIILNLGRGKWQTADKKILKSVLSKTKVVMSNDTVALPPAKIKHYGWIVNELVYRVTKPEN